jgi:sulfatase maturation enzyme AslB (radical SAM superfamily)
MTKITDSPTFCPHAWLSATHTNGGYYKPCCRFTRMADDNHWSMPEQDNIGKLNMIRKDMAQGKHPAQCLNCWREESKGIDSLRTLALKSDWWHPYMDRINSTDEHGSTDIRPVYFDLKLGNKCNLGCVMCHEGDSSVIEQELRDNYDSITDKQKAGLDWMDRNPLTDADINALFDRLESHDDLFSIKFTGGEPFLNHRVISFLETCISKGLQHKITVFFTTNLITLTHKTINLLKNFPKCHISVSMEGVDTIYEYMRWPATWSKFETNWKKLHKTDIPHDVVFTITGLNVPYMPWWMAWVKEQNVHWMPNIVWDPIHLSLPEMPQDLKQNTMQDLLDAKAQWPEDEKLLDGLINTMMQPSATEGKAWERTIEQIEFQDRIRGRSIEKYLPGMIRHVS